MSEANFLRGLMEMDVDGITPAQVKRFLYLYIIAYYSINFETYEFRLRQIFHILNAVKLVWFETTTSPLPGDISITELLPIISLSWSEGYTVDWYTLLRILTCNTHGYDHYDS